MDYIKHFDKQVQDYLLFRPNYPDSLYNYLASLSNNNACVWDCATGNGQAAVALAKHFRQIIATDISQAQLSVAPKVAKIGYVCCTAEKSSVSSQSVDLITIAQALHWFNFDLFYEEVRRVSNSGAVIAAWCYSLGHFDSALDAIIAKLYNNILGDNYWPAQRRYIDQGYQTIPFPFTQMKSPTFIIEKALTFTQLLGYLNTWSAVKEYQKRHQSNPIDLVYSQLESTWNKTDSQQTMRWPLHLLLGQVS